MGMTKIIEVELNLTPDDVVNYIVNADAQTQSAILRKLSNVHYIKTRRFLTQLSLVVKDIKDSYNHDVRNIIKHMVKDLYEHIYEVENENDQL